MKLRKAYISFSTVLLLLTLLCSCSFGPKGAKKNDSSSKITVYFRTRLPGGVTFDAPSRGATPAFSGSSISYDITATPSTAGTAVVTRTVTGSESGNTDFTLPLEPGEWTVSVDGYQTGDTDKKKLFTGSQAVTVVADISQAQTWSIQLSVYTQTEGNGSIELPVSWAADSGIAKMQYKLDSGSYEEMAAPGTISITNVAAGSYTLFLMFYDVNDELVYSLHSTVLVFAGATTSVWRNEVEYDAETEAVKITKENVEAYRSTYFFVDPTPSDKNETGSYYLPYKSLKKCVSRIKSIATADKTYNIFMKGACTENDQIEIENNIVIQLLETTDGSASVSKATGFADNTKLFALKTGGSLVIEDIQITGDLNWQAGTLCLKGNTYIEQGINYDSKQLWLDIGNFAPKDSKKTPISFTSGTFGDGVADGYEKGSVILKDSADTTSGVSAVEIGYFVIDTETYEWTLGIKKRDGSDIADGVLTNTEVQIISLPIFDTNLTFALKLDDAEAGTLVHTIPMVGGEFARCEDVDVYLSASLASAPEGVTVSNLRFTVYSGDVMVDDSDGATGTNPISVTLEDLYLGTYKVLAECDIAGMTYSTSFIIKVVKAE